MPKFVASIVSWYQGEPVVAHYVGVLALTLLAHYGIHLDATTTGAVAGVLGAIATGITRQKVAPTTGA